MVQARRNWAPPEITTQDFGLAVTIAADEPRLFNQVQQRLRVRERLRGRGNRPSPSGRDKCTTDFQLRARIGMRGRRFVGTSIR